MSDIIKDAKQLLDEATPAPWVVYERSFGVIDAIGPIERDPTEGLDVDSGSAELAAAAPELAQALAEETWEYAVAFKSTNGLGYLDRSGKPQPWPLLAAWYLTKEIAQVALMNSEYRKETLCIVRRRVSPVEVIDE